MEELSKSSNVNDAKNKELKMKRIGAYVGKFLPPHIGHISVIDKALSECDEVVVVISDNPKKSKELCRQSGFPYFSSSTRLEWIEKHYKSQNNIKYYVIDESKLKIKPYNMEEYSKLFWKVVKEKVNVKYADESYRELNEKYFAECEFVPIDRDKIAIHGTDIRNDLNNLKFVISEAREDILTRISDSKTI